MQCMQVMRPNRPNNKNKKNNNIAFAKAVHRQFTVPAPTTNNILMDKQCRPDNRETMCPCQWPFQSIPVIRRYDDHGKL